MYTNMTHIQTLDSNSHQSHYRLCTSVYVSCDQTITCKARTSECRL